MMVICVHGFDWAVYEKEVMPAFARWLIDKDTTAVRTLFEQTRFAQEEAFLPDPMQRLRAWPRAEAFVESLPRGLHSRREYQLLCSAEQFTALSDTYMYTHFPRLYHNSDALCSIWGALIEDLCLPWNPPQAQDPALAPDVLPAEPPPAKVEGSSPTTTHEELVSLLNIAGLPELAREVAEQDALLEAPAAAPNEEDEEDEEDEDFSDLPTLHQGIIIGRHPNTLRLRGWIAGISLRGMALFEYLACGRRAIPFGAELDSAIGTYVGYLTPDEVEQLAICLQHAQAPPLTNAEEDYHDFRFQHTRRRRDLRLIDEVLPTNADLFLLAVATARNERLGLICSTST